MPLAFVLILGGLLVAYLGLSGNSLADVLSGQSSGSGNLPGPLKGSSLGYVNPVPGASTSRIDQGVDYTLSPQGFLAPAQSQILQADSSNPGWQGGGYIAAKILSGPYTGQVYYVAEGVSPAPGIKAGAVVPAGTPLVVRATNPYNGILGNIEAGWANPNSPGQPLAQVTGGYSEGQQTAAGKAWNQFIAALGGSSVG